MSKWLHTGYDGIAGDHGCRAPVCGDCGDPLVDVWCDGEECTGKCPEHGDVHVYHDDCDFCGAHLEDGGCPEHGANFFVPGEP